MRSKIRDFIVSKIGDGSSTSAWFDNWHPAGPLSKFISARHIKAAGFNPDSKVADLVINGSWVRDDPWRDTLHNLLPQNLPSLSPSVPDKLQWRSSDGNLSDFSVRSVWQSIRPYDQTVDSYHLVWFSQNIPRHAFILWVALKNRLKTHDKIKIWDTNSNLICAFCGDCADSLSHLFFECSFPSMVWHDLQHVMNLSVPTDSWSDIINQLKPVSKIKTIWSII
ncbi:hypothetical protein L2E82_35422 [Cichorium intybus]|uniref:Uncharacterized protein n=1 Tax=Cichorium intybus TaxID=13427 RepID=A0ACB9BNV6_CICIN|nr:hypothetical protein L2E82_35422 [Cichorium intybus]